MAMPILMTRADYEALPEGTRMELCDGLLVKQPSPRFGHQRIVDAILRALHEHLGGGPATGPRALPGPVDVLVDEINVFVPDIVVLDTLPDDEAPYVGVPRIVVEVLSPSTRDRDRDYKARRLLGLGVREVWLVDRHARTVDIVGLEGLRRAEGSAALHSDALPGFTLVPDAVFGPR